MIESRVDHGGLWPVRPHQVDGLGVVLLALGGAVGDELAYRICFLSYSMAKNKWPGAKFSFSLKGATGATVRPAFGVHIASKINCPGKKRKIKLLKWVRPGLHVAQARKGNFDAMFSQFSNAI